MRVERGKLWRVGNGARLQLISPVHVGQKLVLVNAATMEDEDCQVVHVDDGNEERVTVAVCFGNHQEVSTSSFRKSLCVRMRTSSWINNPTLAN